LEVKMTYPKGRYREHNYNRVLQYIIRYKTEHDGKSPTVREIMRGCGIGGTCATRYILLALEEEGRIKLQAGGVRGIQVVGGRWEAPAL
jgi:hypothetical protein